MSSVAAAPAPAPVIGTVFPKGGALGLLPELSRDPLGLLTWCVRTYGDFVRVRLGLTPAIILGHPELVEEVLVTRNHDYHKAQSTRRLGSLFGRGLLLSEGEFWLRQRRLVQPAFHRQRITAMSQTMLATACELLETWREGDVRTINLDMMEVTLRIAGRALFGTDVGADFARIRACSWVLNEHFRSRLFSLLTLLPDTVPTPGNRRFQAAVRDLDRVVLRIIGERRARADVGDDVLGMLLAARDEDGRGMHDRQLRDEVLGLLLAGHDTTALALTWAFVLLARHPTIDARLFAELQDVLGDRPPGADDVPRLVSTGQVVAEAMRLYPPAWAIGREAVRDTTIGGQPVARGTTILIVPWVLHRDPRFFDAPEAFRPERWADGLAERLPRFAYVPFGGGQRICIGNAFALLEATLLLASIAQRFRLELADPREAVEPWPVVTLRPRNDVRMRLRGRPGY